MFTVYMVHTFGARLQYDKWSDTSIFCISPAFPTLSPPHSMQNLRKIHIWEPDKYVVDLIQTHSVQAASRRRSSVQNLAICVCLKFSDSKFLWHTYLFSNDMFLYIIFSDSEEFWDLFNSIKLKQWHSINLEQTKANSTEYKFSEIQSKSGRFQKITGKKVYWRKFKQIKENSKKNEWMNEFIS